MTTPPTTKQGLISLHLYQLSYYYWFELQDLLFLIKCLKAPPDASILLNPNFTDFALITCFWLKLLEMRYVPEDR